ncbi:MAG TPA: hypothetical protein VGQ76_17245 [Thermoanaerobaculia bacterium]|jgi:hypothetical protein|nr:hypothetical protein [Thermoanaerobaculia bacterium]
MRVLTPVLVLVLALPVLAADPAANYEYEQLMLPVAPSLVFCGYESRYETRLVAYNDAESQASRICENDRCHDVQAKSGREITNVDSAGTPLPVFLYVEKETAAKMRMSLNVEASTKDKLDERGFIELPIVRASDFTEGKLQLVGLRMDPGFRQTVRMFGLNGEMSGYVMMRVYSLMSNELLFEWPFYVGPLSSEKTSDGKQLRPAFGMECDMSAYLKSYGQKVRIDLESMTPGMKYWAFISVTNNKTQHFYTVLPKAVN